MRPIDVLQDAGFGAWLYARLGPDHSEPGSELALPFDMAGAWPFDGSVITALARLSNGPCDYGAEEAAEVFYYASEYAEHLSKQRGPNDPLRYHER